MTQTVLVDIWDTLVENPYPHPIDRIQQQLHLPQTHNELVDTITHSHIFTQEDSERAWQEVIQALLPDQSVEQITKKAQQAKLIWEESAKTGTIFPGAKSFLTKLKAKGYKVGLASSIDKESFNILEERFSLKEHVDFLALSYDMGENKSELYYKTIIENQSLDPTCTIMVGDSIWSDCLPASKVGMEAILIHRRPFKRNDKKNLPRSCSVCTTFQEVLYELEKK